MLKLSRKNPKQLFTAHTFRALYRPFCFISIALLFLVSSAQLHATTNCGFAGGDPVVSTNDQGTFVWKDCSTDQWHLRIAAANTSQYHDWISFDGSLSSTFGFTDINPIKHDPQYGDVVSNNEPHILSYFLNHSQYNHDVEGVDFSVPIGSELCLTVVTSSTPSQLPIYVGNGRLPVTSNVNPETLDICTQSDAVANNQAPTITAISDLGLAANTPLSIAVQADDLDGDTLIYSASGLPIGSDINPATGVISGLPTITDIYYITAKVTDGGLAAETSFALTITDLILPTIENSLDLSYEIEKPLLIAVAAIGYNRTPLSYSATGLPAGTVINPTTGAITGTPTAVDNYYITITVTDGYLSAEDSFVLTITETNATNQPPTLAAITDQSSYLNTELSLQIVASDLENDPLVFTSAGHPYGVDIDQYTGKYTGKPIIAGVFNVSVSVKDDNGVDVNNFLWTVSPNESIGVRNYTPAQYSGSADIAFTTISKAIAQNLYPAPEIIRIGSDSDGTVVHYQRVISKPNHEAYFQIKSGSTTKFYEIAEPEILVTTLGAVCNGVTGDSAAINKAADVAIKLLRPLVFPADKTCVIDQPIYIEAGIPLIAGGKLKIKKSNNKYGFVLLGRKNGRSNNVNNLTISDIEIDLNNTSARAIYGLNSHDILIRNMNFKNQMGGSILFKAFKDAGDISSIEISHSKFEGDTSLNPDGEAIKFASELDFIDTYTSEYWLKHFTISPTDHISKNINIHNNHIVGGYYGIGMTHVEDSVISNNNITDNMRNISCQQGCKRNKIQDNLLENSISASIHLAYEPEDNLIERNKITSSRSRGEGLLQAYIAPKRNIFKNNSTHVSGTGPKYHAYIAVNANGNQLIGNSFSGTALRAYIALESEWNPSETFISHRGGFTGIGGYASADSYDNVISNNIISPTSNVPAIFTSQITSSGGIFRLDSTNITDNSVTTEAVSYYIYQLEHTSGSLAGSIVTNNRYATVDRNKIVLAD